MPHPLIGREAERKELLGRLDEALAGRGSIVMIGGEPGIGKTHLITAFLEEARRRGAYANIGHCYDLEGSPPYVPFIEMLERTAQVAPKEAFRRTLGDAASEIAKLMPELRRMYPDIPTAIQLPPEQQRRFLFNAYREFMERAAKITPIVQVFEDLHWADEPTLLLLQHAAQMLPTAPMLVIGTYRDGDLEVTRPFAKTLELMLRQKQATRMSLRRLAAGGVESMLTAMSAQTPPPWLASVVFARTEGNPFFVEQVFRHLAEEGKLLDETGKWRPDLRADQLQVPETVRLVLGKRLDRLGADARRVLTAAAVIGQSVSLRLLEELEHQQPDAALDAVEAAERARLVSAEPAAGGEMRYRFVHELVRQTLAETVPLPRRQQLHARVAEAMERVYAANLEAQASPLAHHLYQAAAADREKTTTCLAIAAQKAGACAASEEALSHIENALSLWDGEEGLRVAELTVQKAGALHSMGRRDEAMDNYRKAIAMFEKAGAMAKVAKVSLMLARIHGGQLEYAAANRTIEQALACLGSAEPGLQFHLLALRAAVMSGSGDVAGAANLWADLGARRKSPEGDRGSALSNSFGAHFYVHSMQWEQAVTVARRAAETLRASGDLWGAANVECIVGFATCCGHPEAASDLFGAMELAEKVGHHNALWAAKTVAVMPTLARGDLQRAEREMEEVWNLGETHQLAVNFWTDNLRGGLAFLRGNCSEAERWFRYRQEPLTHLFGAKDASLFALWAESKDDRAWNAWTERRWKMPRAGQLNAAGDWLALERSIVGLASMGRKEEAAALRPLTEELVRTGVWVSNSAPLPDRCRHRCGLRGRLARGRRPPSDGDPPD